MLDLHFKARQQLLAHGRIIIQPFAGCQRRGEGDNLGLAVRVQLTDGLLTEKPFNLETDSALADRWYYARRVLQRACF